jgi:hypothetical protein
MPPPSDVSFAPAAPGGRVRAMTALSFGIIGVIAAVCVYQAVQEAGRAPTWVTGIGMALAPGLGAVIVAGVWFGARIQAYRLAGGELVIVRRFHQPRFPLAGLESAVLDRAAMEGARKRCGNDGLGAVSGRFRSRKLGTFHAYLTNPQHGVVLRWPDRVLVVSPDRGYAFIEAVRKRAGLET